MPAQSIFASTRSVQIATTPIPCFSMRIQSLPPHAPCRLQLERTATLKIGKCLCLHTPRADCNGCSVGWFLTQLIFASTRPVQIATVADGLVRPQNSLCLHTPRADCNPISPLSAQWLEPLPPHAPCRLQPVATVIAPIVNTLPPHAPCRLQPMRRKGMMICRRLCLHTPRADCNAAFGSAAGATGTLPPHAPCRLQRRRFPLI